MLKLVIAILLVAGSPLSKNVKTANSDIIQTLMPNDDTTGGEGGHIPPHPLG